MPATRTHTATRLTSSRMVDFEPSGIVIVDKPAGLTSHDVVARMRRVLGTRKVGHGGTLDPMATGVLVIACGKATRLLTYYSARDKTYEATIRLGVSTVTDDAEGDISASADASGVTDGEIAIAIAQLTGDIVQRPSAVSAIKVDGKRAYARVRAGEDVELAERPVTVSRFDLAATRRGPSTVDLDIVVTVSSGTYVRALARDLGAALGVGGHLTSLRRTAVGMLTVDAAVSLDALLHDNALVPLIDLATAARAVLPTYKATDKSARALGFGQAVPRDPASGAGDHVAITESGQAVAIVRARGDQWMPAIVFVPSRSTDGHGTPAQ